MEKMSEKFKCNADPETFKEFFNLWLKMYEKATDDIYFQGVRLFPSLLMKNGIR